MGNNFNASSTVFPPEKLTYDEWVDTLKREQNVIVSSKFLAKSVENRIARDEAILLKMEHENLLKKTDGTAKHPILFGIQKLFKFKKKHHVL